MMGRDRHELERKGLLHSKREDTEPYLRKQQEANEMISLTTNTRGMTTMEENHNFSVMSGPELVAMFNKMAESATGKELGIRTVTRFADTQSGIKRCEMLASSIKARKSGLAQKGDEDMATKKKAAAPAKKTEAAKDNGKSKIVNEFGAKGVRAKILDAMGSKKMVPIAALLKAAYGSQNTENKGALMMSIRGAEATIKKNRLPYQIKKEKNPETKEISLGLYPK